MADLKISQMTDGGLVEITDEIPVNRGGQNYKVKVGEASTYDVGAADSDLPTGLDVTNKINNAISNVTDQNVKISIDDTESGFLEDKIVAGTNITIAKDVDSSGFEKLTINSSGGGGSGVQSVNDILPDIDGNVLLNSDNVPYDNTDSGLTATDVQESIDEIAEDWGKLDRVNTWTAGQAADVQTPASGSTLTPNLNDSNAISYVANQNFTLANPSNKTVGQTFVIEIINNGGGAWAITYGSQYIFPTGADKDISTVLGSSNILYGYVSSPTVIKCGLNKGYP